jgi:hypothetical protein
MATEPKAELTADRFFDADGQAISTDHFGGAANMSTDKVVYITISTLLEMEKEAGIFGYQPEFFLAVRAYQHMKYGLAK